MDRPPLGWVPEGTAFLDSVVGITDCGCAIVVLVTDVVLIAGVGGTDGAAVVGKVGEVVGVGSVLGGIGVVVGVVVGVGSAAFTP